MAAQTGGIRLTVAQGQAFVGLHEWKKGQAYVRGLSSLSVQPEGLLTMLRGTAHGQERYTVWVSLNADGPAEAECSCPVGGGGGCKHVAALLARAADDPAAFAALRPTDDVLSGMNAEQLRSLIRRMLVREPGLLGLLQSVPRPGERSDLRQRIELAFAGVDYDPEEDWEGEGPDLRDLEALLAEAQAQLEQAHALTPQAQTDLLEALVALLDGCAELNDDGYDLGLDEFVGPARTGVLRLLALNLPEVANEIALDALQESVAEFGWNTAEIREQRGLIAALPPETRHVLRAFVQGLLDGMQETYAARRLAATLLALSGPEHLGPAEELRLARATGDQAEVIRVLLRQGQPEQAVAALTEGSRALPPQAIEAEFTAHDLLPQLEDHARTHLQVYGARAWLYIRLRATDRDTEAYTLARDAVLVGTGDHPDHISTFLARDLDWLQELRSISPDWPTDREAYIRKLWKRPLLANVLMRFLLDETLLDRAEELATRRTSPGVDPGLIGELALKRSAEQAQPLLLRALEGHIAGRHREHYQQAAALLSAAEPLLGQSEVRAIARLLCQEYPRLSALKDELLRAGLIEEK